MDYTEREFAIQQIIAGQYFLQFKNKTYIFKEPDHNLNLRASFKYTLFYKEALEEGFLSEEDENDLLISEGLIESNYKDKLDTFNDNLRILKSERRKNKFRSKEIARIDKLIERTHEEIDKIYKITSQFRNLSAKFQANSKKSDWLLAHCLYHEDGETRVWGSLNEYESESDTIFTDWFLAQCFYNLFFSVKEIREIARSEPWGTIWKTSCKMGQSVFNQSNLTYHQFLLSYWTNLYESIRESYEPPSPDVIDDDELLDGWLEEQAEKNKTKQKNKGDNLSHVKNSKIKNAQEVFVMVDTKEDAKKVYNTLNDDSAKNRIRQREKVIQEKGKVVDSQLPDVQQGLQMEMTRLRNESIQRTKRGNR